jgi:DNA-binding MarR family transcriptional regulator
VNDLGDREYKALARFRHALRKFLRFSEEEARRAGLTPAQHQLLLVIRGFGDGDGVGPSVSEVAERLQQRHHSVVELVDRAEAGGLVTRTEDQADRRRHLVQLTPTGRDTLARLSVAHRDELRRFRREMADVLDELP